MWPVIRELIGDDEEGTLNRLRSIRADVIDPKISEHRGRIVKPPEDGLLLDSKAQWLRVMRNVAAQNALNVE